MVVIIEDKTPRKVILTGLEIEILIEELSRAPHTLFEFMQYDKIIKKLKKAKKVNK